ncbi:hypothetical protein CCR81_06655 [Halorhodospira halophila]|nr:hypothetical protein [Halorhodospira halophila]MBK5943906.1 hypothetical protein [Halorhodospira halophila]
MWPCARAPSSRTASLRTSSERAGPRAVSSGPAPHGVARLGGLWLGVFLDAQGRVARVAVSVNALAPAPDETADPQALRVVRCLESWEQHPAGPARLPRAPAATPFQACLRDALLELQPGQTVSYGALARRLGTSPRAVGAGCRANPLPLLVPCHRVVGLRGSGGYAGARQGHLTQFKAWLLEREQRASAPRGPSP